MPLAVLPYTNSAGGARSSERRYAFNREGTKVLVITAKSFPSSFDWLNSLVEPLNENSPLNPRTSRSSWSLEWWDLGDYSARVSQSSPITTLAFASDGQTILASALLLPLTVQCFRTNEQPETSTPVLALSSNLEFLVKADTKTGLVLRACEPTDTSIPFTHDLINVKAASITPDGLFLALVGSNGKSGADAVVDVYRLNGNRYEREKRLQTF